jgi:molybdopterin converting factor subunit 1
MRVTVLYFAVVGELVGRVEETLELPPSVRTIDQFASWLPSQRAELGGRMASIRIAQNEEFADGANVVGEGDVLALIPPVAGG